MEVVIAVKIAGSRVAQQPYVIYQLQPQNWDVLGKGVKHDRLDAAAVCQRLDRYELGDKKAFSTVRIPTVHEERERAMSRLRQ